ncbi:MAG TPA: class I SAM-dependent methyltransferase [Terriglobales bacterium]|nr:class I SAM-dependent methyltransferase [Terriglobales bacterium]
MAMTQEKPDWGSSYRLIAAEKWKAKSAVMGRDVTLALVEYARPQEGMEVLDLASGTGEPAISIAQRVGPKGHVSALDLSADLLDIARKRATQRQLENISFHQGNAHALPFPDNSFDLATCRFGVMFFADVHSALRELHRVLRPGARACFAAWGAFEQPYWQSTMGVVLQHVAGPAFPPGGQDPFRFADPASLPSALARAGFNQCEASLRNVPWSWLGTADEVWEYAQAVSTPFRSLLDRVPESRWPQVNADVYEAISMYANEDGIHFGADIVFASGSK